MTETPIVDQIQSGAVTYDIASKKIKNTNNNAGASDYVKVWHGTQQEYEAIVDKDPDTVYNISDESPSQTVYDATLTIQENGTSVGTFTANASQSKSINITVPTTASDVNALPDSTKYGDSLYVSVNDTTHVVSVSLKDQDNNVLNTQTFNLPTTYIHEQASASDTWTIAHNLHKRPSVTVVDSSGEVQGAKETYIDDNTIKLEFNSPFVGKAYLN